MVSRNSVLQLSAVLLKNDFRDRFHLPGLQHLYEEEKAFSFAWATKNAFSDVCAMASVSKIDFCGEMQTYWSRVTLRFRI